CWNTRERVTRFWEPLRLRQADISDQYRDPSYCSVRETFCALPPHPIIGIVEPAPTVAVGHSHPIRSDHNKHGSARPQGVAKRLFEIDTGINAGNVFEDLLRREMPSQVVRESSGRMFRVLAAVADEDARRAHAHATFFLSLLTLPYQVCNGPMRPLHRSLRRCCTTNAGWRVSRGCPGRC